MLQLLVPLGYALQDSFGQRQSTQPVPELAQSGPVALVSQGGSVHALQHVRQQHGRGRSMGTFGLCVQCVMRTSLVHSSCPAVVQRADLGSLIVLRRLDLTIQLVNPAAGMREVSLSGPSGHG